jgi:hypothetical protein
LQELDNSVINPLLAGQSHGLSGFKATASPAAEIKAYLAATD